MAARLRSLESEVASLRRQVAVKGPIVAAGVQAIDLACGDHHIEEKYGDWESAFVIDDFFAHLHEEHSNDNDEDKKNSPGEQEHAGHDDQSDGDDNGDVVTAVENFACANRPISTTIGNTSADQENNTHHGPEISAGIGAATLPEHTGNQQASGDDGGICEGDFVEVRHLQSAVGLNGAHGLVLRLIPGTGRFEVLLNLGFPESKAIRPSNLLRVGRAEEHAWASFCSVGKDFEQFGKIMGDGSSDEDVDCCLDPVAESAYWTWYNTLTADEREREDAIWA